MLHASFAAFLPLLPLLPREPLPEEPDFPVLEPLEPLLVGRPLGVLDPGCVALLLSMLSDI